MTQIVAYEVNDNAREIIKAAGGSVRTAATGPGEHIGIVEIITLPKNADILPGVYTNTSSVRLYIDHDMITLEHYHPSILDDSALTCNESLAEFRARTEPEPDDETID